MTVYIEIADEKLGVKLNYKTSMLSTGQAKNVVSTLQSALEMILNNPEATVAGLGLATQRDMDQIRTWNESSPVVVNRVLHKLIAETVERWPDLPAITDRNCGLSYAELDILSNKLAHHLVDLGVMPATSVLICFEKSIWAVVSMLAVLKAGGGFVPLNPAAPRLRILSVIESTRSNIALSSPESAGCIQDLVKHVVCVSASMLHALPDCTSAIESNVEPADIAYTMFTSGSTGIPKGVVVEHFAISSTLFSLAKHFQFGPHSRMFQFTAYTFDAALFEIFVTLISGGCICVCSEEDRLENLPQAMEELGVNTAFFTPSMLRLLEPEDLPSLKVLLVGGEAIGSDNLNTWCEKVEMHCVYGPTEASIWCVSSLLKMGDSHDVIGRAIGCHTWIVAPDDDQKLAPVGSIGELVLSGPCLARGYLDDEEKTARAFVRSLPWFREYGRLNRIYKTGDLVRYHADGKIAFIGRKDNQVKIRGQRVELGDIEHHVNLRFKAAKHLAVDVITPSGGPDSQKIVVFIHLGNKRYIGPDLEPHCLPLSDELQASLAMKMVSLSNDLPSYMIPSYYVLVSRMPWTSSGKLDRKRLLGMISSLNRQQLKAYTLNQSKRKTPSTSVGRQLQTLWEQTLGIPAGSIGADDDFFQLGGDSILAMKLCAKASKINLTITVAQVFQAPKLSSLALLTEKASTSTAHSNGHGPFGLIPDVVHSMGNNELVNSIAQLCDVSIDAIEDAYPCTPLQEGLMALSVLQPGTYLGQRVFRLPRNISLARLKEAYQETSDSIPILRTRIIILHTFGSLQVVLKPGALDWFYSSGLEKTTRTMLENSINYGAPLVRASIVEEQDEKYFVWTAHHALYDGWSLPIIFKYLEKAYSHEILEESIPFSNYIGHIRGSNLEHASSFWTSQFLGDSPKIFPTLPSSHYHPIASSVMNANISNMPHRNSEWTLSSILRGAWAILASCYSSSDDVVFGATLSGRTAPVPGIQEIIGPTISTMPIRIQVDRNESIASYLRKVQDQATEMIPFEYYGLQNIARLSENAKTAVNFQTLMVIQPAAGEGQFLGAELLSQGKTELNAYALILECQLRDLSGSTHRIGSASEREDDRLNTAVHDDGVGISVQALFDPGVLTFAKVEMILSDFEHIVRQLVEWPERRVRDLYLLSSDIASVSLL